MQGKGKEQFVSMINAMIGERQKRCSTVNIELGTYYNDGIFPDSYLKGADTDREPDPDYYLISVSPLQEGDRVLVLWTDEGDMVAIGKLEGGGEDG